MPPKAVAASCEHEDVELEDHDSTGFCCKCNKWLEGSPGAWIISKDYNSSTDEDEDGVVLVDEDIKEATKEDECGELCVDIDILDPTRPRDGKCRRCDTLKYLNDDGSWENRS
jgi:hypothetical protein